MLKVFEKITHWQERRLSLLNPEQTLGFVPTMGALHAGHRSLFEQARRENHFVLASIFVNPTQFNDPNDLKNYPKTIEKDKMILDDCGVDFLILPQFDEIYPDQYRYRVSENHLSKILCGASRPGHFDGVLSVVLKLLMIAQAHRAYFGEKDYQQYLLIRDMAAAFFLPTSIRSCPTIRESDGLAMSSRNLLLTLEERNKAPLFYHALKHSPNLESARMKLEDNGFRVDYLEEHMNRRFGAVFFGKVRLIDNVPIL